MASLSLRHLGKTYDNGFRAIRDFNLEIKDKELIIFAGPASCGVSTVLRMIAGLEEITEGELFIDEEKVNQIDSRERNIAMIFPNGKLYPQMSVYENLAFGLKLQEVPEDEIQQRIEEAAQVLNIKEMLEKKTEELSEMEAAVVAVGRAIVRKPKVILLDDPFANLSMEVKKYMQKLICRLHETMRITAIYVTHDREDLLNMDARIVVMNDGTLQQVGTVRELCDHPSTPYVSAFFGQDPILVH